jgi:hypothetical protein
MTKRVLLSAAMLAGLQTSAQASADPATATPPVVTAADKEAADKAAAEKLAADNAAAEKEAADKAAADKLAADQAAGDKGDKPVVDEKSASAGNEAVVALLNTQLEAKDKQIVSLTIEKQTLEAKAADAAAVMPALLEIATKSASTMNVALGGAELSMTGLTAAQIVAEHARLSTSFTAKFPVGGVAAQDAKASPAVADVGIDPMHHVRLNAVRPQSAKG